MTRIITEQSFDHRLLGVAQLIQLYETAGQIPDRALPNVSELPLLPQSRAEARGAMYALDVMQTWAAQLEASARHLPDDPAPAAQCSLRAIATRRALFVQDLARAQQLGFMR